MKAVIHVNQATIRKNAKLGTDDPPIIIRTHKGREVARSVEIVGSSRVVYRPHKPLDCGARLWIECDYTQVQIVE